MAKTKAKNQTKKSSDVTKFSFVNYLQSAKGHEIASRIISVIEDIKKATINLKSQQYTIQSKILYKQKMASIIINGIVLFLIISGAIYLSLTDKLTSTLGLLFGSIAGYIIGKEKVIIFDKK